MRNYSRGWIRPICPDRSVGIRLEAFLEVFVHRSCWRSILDIQCFLEQIGPFAVEELSNGYLYGLHVSASLQSREGSMGCKSRFGTWIFH